MSNVVPPNMRLGRFVEMVAAGEMVRAFVPPPLPPTPPIDILGVDRLPTLTPYITSVRTCFLTAFSPLIRVNVGWWC